MYALVTSCAMRPARLSVLGGYLLAVLCTLFVLAAVLTLTALIVRVQRRRQRRRLAVEVQNTGNVVSQYGLRAEGADGALHFEWAQSGAALDTQQEAAPVEAAGGLKRARAGAQSASRLADALAKGLEFLARLLPRSWASGPRKAAGRLRQGQSKLDRIVRAPARIAQRTRALFKLKPGRARASRQAGRAPSPDAGSAAVAWGRTAPVAPGAAVTVDLIVEAARPFQAQQRTVRIYSRAAGHDDVPPVTMDHVLTLDGVPLIQRAVPLLALWVGAIVVLFVVFRLLRAGMPV